jgi:hypothetical protein
MKKLSILIPLLVIVVIVGIKHKASISSNVNNTSSYNEVSPSPDQKPIGSNPTVKENPPTPKPTPVKPKSIPDPLPPTSYTCEAHDGNWSAEYKECNGISENTCKSIGGTYDGCASACRHDPKAEMCTMQCVQICTLR